MSAFGNFMLMMFLFPRAREMLDDTPVDSTAEYHLSGWMQMKKFLEWIHRFITFSRPIERKLLILLLRLESRT
jgi:hypothetical protein